MFHECEHCHKKAQNLKRCASCSIVWYCDSDCQKKNWPIHLVDCNLGRPTTTAERLVACVLKPYSPDDETRRDYGFTHTPMFEELRVRLEVYSLLIVDLQVKAKTIHHWMMEGNLDSMMRQTFDARLSPAERQKEPYLWFCKHQSTFKRDPDPLSPAASTVTMLQAAFREAWTFIGGNPLDSDEAIRVSIRDFTVDRKTCFFLITTLLADMQPSPGRSMNSDEMARGWVEFGFVACRSEGEQHGLVTKYLDLLELASFDAFCQAYSSSSLPKLFEHYGLRITGPYILDVLSSRNYKSVWHLKEYVGNSAVESQNTPNYAPPMNVGQDYGFSNCRNFDETLALRNVYKQVLLQSEADPLGLHTACLRGELFEYVGEIARLKPAQLFRRLMKNPYRSAGK